MKLSISWFCFTLWPSVEDSLGNSCPWEVLSLVEGHSELPSRKKPWASTYRLLQVDLWLPPFLLKAASSCKARAYLGRNSGPRPAFRPNCLKQDFGFHSQGQALMNWMLNSPMMCCLSPSLPLVQHGKVKLRSRLKISTERVNHCYSLGWKQMFFFLHFTLKGKKKPQTNITAFDASEILQAEYAIVALFLLLFSIMLLELCTNPFTSYLNVCIKGQEGSWVWM